MTVENKEKQENRVVRRRHFSIFWPVLLISIGVLLFLNNVGVIQGSGWDLAVSLWPVLLIVGGLDGLFRREGMVGAVVLIGLGTLFLLSNLGYLTLSVWEIIIRFWPVFLVALGIDIIIGHRKPWAPILGALIGLLLVAGIAFLIVGAPGVSTGRTEQVTFPLNDLSQANGSIAIPVGRLDLSGGAASGSLLEGDAKLGALGTVNKNAVGNSFYLNAEPITFNPINAGDSDHWQLHLNPAVSYNLTVNMAAGVENVDLTGLSVTRVNLNMAVGSLVVRLPATAVTGEIKGAVGETVVYVPRGAVVHIHLDTGLTGVNLPSDFMRNDKEVTSPNQQAAGPAIDLTVGQALGAVSIRYLP